MNDTDERVRVDKWLWAARFFKTRALASDAVSGGHIHVNGQRVKPSRTLSPNDVIQIRKGEETFVVTVLALATQRGPATKAQLLYREHDDSRRARELYAEQRKLERMGARAPVRRPDKRGRREIARIKGRDV